MPKYIQQPDVTKPKKKKKKSPADYLGGLAGTVVQAKRSHKAQLEGAEKVSSQRDTGARTTAKTKVKKKTAEQAEKDRKKIREQIARRIEAEKKRQEKQRKKNAM